MENAPCFVGIDVSKAHLDVASRPDGQGFQLPNTVEGIASLIKRLAPLAPTLILLEATGGLEWAAAVALAEAKSPVRIVEPGRVRHFARSIGQHSKTDAIDARVLAHYAEAVRPEVRDLPDEGTRDLQALLDRRRLYGNHHRRRGAGRDAAQPHFYLVRRSRSGRRAGPLRRSARDKHHGRRQCILDRHARGRVGTVIGNGQVVVDVAADDDGIRQTLER